MTTTVPTANQHHETRPTANIGSATAALLAQVPADLAEQIRDAVTEDLYNVFSFALGAGRTNAFRTMEEQGIGTGCRPFCASHITTPADGELCIGNTVRLDFRAPDRTAGHTDGVSFGLGYSNDEGDNAFVKFTGQDAVYMDADDLRALAAAALKLTEGVAR